MKQDVQQKIYDFLDSLECEVDIVNYIDIENINYSNAFYSILEMLEERGAFNIDVIYYSVAIEYLSQNDPSLKESLNLATEMCYEPQDLSSEILASLLKSKFVRDEFYELEDEINEFFLTL